MSDIFYEKANNGLVPILFQVQKSEVLQYPFHFVFNGDHLTKVI